MSITRNQASGAYRRWEPIDFDPPPSAPAPEPAPEPAPPPEPTPPPPAIRLPTAEEFEAMQAAAEAEARNEGFAAGREAGYEEGYRQGHAEGLEAGRRSGWEAGHAEGREAGYGEGQAQAQAESASLAALVGSFEDALTHFDAEVAEEIAALALEIARRIVRQSVATQPEGLLDTIRQALQQLPHTHATVHLNPADLGLVHEYFKTQPGHFTHRLIEDDGIARGGCRIEAGGSEIDARLETRWRRVLAAMGLQQTDGPDAAPGDS